jgi:hypothetical protein
MTSEAFDTVSCDLCGQDKAEEIPAVRHYTNDQPIHVCTNCGFIYVRKRRSAQAIADSWSKELYVTGPDNKPTYTARWPMVKARQTFIADYTDSTIGLKNKRLCDIGGGEGQFLDIARAPNYGAKVFAIEPSVANCKQLTQMGIENFEGTIEAYRDANRAKPRLFDIATAMWTLEASRDPRGMMDAAYDLLEMGGHLVIGTGSRILVPFKKPLQYYLSTHSVDLHPVRFSVNTLAGLFAVSGFEMAHVNRYMDSDWMCMIGRKVDRSKKIAWKKDDYREVIDFFKRWHEETQAHYQDA